MFERKKDKPKELEQPQNPDEARLQRLEKENATIKARLLELELEFDALRNKVLRKIQTPQRRYP